MRAKSGSSAADTSPQPLAIAVQSTGFALLVSDDFMRRLMAAAFSTLSQQSSQVCTRVILNAMASLRLPPGPRDRILRASEICEKYISSSFT